MCKCPNLWNQTLNRHLPAYSVIQSPCHRHSSSTVVFKEKTASVCRIYNKLALIANLIQSSYCMLA